MIWYLLASARVTYIAKFMVTQPSLEKCLSMVDWDQVSQLVSLSFRIRCHGLYAPLPPKCDFIPNSSSIRGGYRKHPSSATPHMHAHKISFSLYNTPIAASSAYMGHLYTFSSQLKRFVISPQRNLAASWRIRFIAEEIFMCRQFGWERVKVTLVADVIVAPFLIEWKWQDFSLCLWNGSYVLLLLLSIYTKNVFLSMICPRWKLIKTFFFISTKNIF